MSFIIKRYRLEESGATAIEYGLIVAMIAVVLVGIFSTGQATESLYETLIEIVDAMVNAGN